MQLETVGEIVRVLRSRRGLEQVELARACGWRDASAVSRIETDRIHPTRRTLIRLAESLADPSTTGSAEEIKGHLFLAAGLPPTADDIERVNGSLPRIESWDQPAAIVDFTWTIWRSNAAFRSLLGLTDGWEARNLLELFFEPGSPIRRHLGNAWGRGAVAALKQFRAETDRRAEQRWYRVMMARLDRLPELRAMWDEAAPPRTEIRQRYSHPGAGGTIALLRLGLLADARLSLMHVVPESGAGARALQEVSTVLEA